MTERGRCQEAIFDWMIAHIDYDQKEAYPTPNQILPIII
jgi:hypothetical protein